MSSASFDSLVDQLSRLPGIGRKTALRLAFCLVDDMNLSRELTQALDRMNNEVAECSRCRNLTESELCEICSDPSRSSSICIVESPADLRSIEETGLFRGLYFVLHGLLAPLDGFGPSELGIDRLREMISDTGAREIIMALDSTAEGEATCSYLSRALRSSGAEVTRLARGLPPGASVEFADALTLSQAFEGRQRV